jgi:hypothetical protein
MRKLNRDQSAIEMRRVPRAKFARVLCVLHPLWYVSEWFIHGTESRDLSMFPTIHIPDKQVRGLQ